MDRKAWIIIILCLGGLFWSQYEAQKQTKAYQAARAQLAAEKAKNKPVATPVTSNTAPLEAVSNAVTAVSEKPLSVDTPATTQKLRTAVAEYTFTSAGGIQKIELLGHKGENGGHVFINSTFDVPIGVITTQPGQWVKSNETIREIGQNALELESILPSGVQIRKTFTVGKSDIIKDDYQLKYEITFSNPGAAKLSVDPWYVTTGAAAAIHERDQTRYTSFDYQAGSKTIYKSVDIFNAGRIPLIGIQTSPEKTEIRESASDILWAGTKNQYFSTMLQPLGDLRGDTIWASRYALPQKTTDAPKHYAILGALGFPSFSLAPGESKTQAFTFYAGPKEYSRLKTLGNSQDTVMEFGFFGFFSSTLLQAMNWIHGFVKNYGIAIIVLTLIIKTGLWTIQNKSMKSMKKMSLLAPKMNELKEKYKSDPTRMNTEVMKLYKDYGVNPFAGCLPMLVQMPIFFGFYSMLAVAVELRNSSFLWVSDLSQPDTIAHIAGFPINVLPLVMAMTMLWQMQLTPKTGDSSQQKIFMFMPIFFLFICYNYASALALYWTVQNIFSIVQLYLTRNAQLPELVKVNTVPVNAKVAKTKR